MLTDMAKIRDMLKLESSFGLNQDLRGEMVRQDPLAPPEKRRRAWEPGAASPATSTLTTPGRGNRHAGLGQACQLELARLVIHGEERQPTMVGSFAFKKRWDGPSQLQVLIIAE